jgi:5-formyltetrahydrofolate cyclo-ligase
VNASAERRELRQRLAAERARLAPAARMAAAEALAVVLERLPEFLVDQRVAGYWAVRGELALPAVFRRLQQRAQRYYLPVLVAGRRLRFAEWQPGVPLQPNRYGIPEPVCALPKTLRPAALDLVLLPLLAFDRQGNRLGSGAGYYDRSFAFLREVARPARPLLVGVGYHFQEVPALVPQPLDVSLDFVATDRELIACRPAPTANGAAAARER